MAFERKLSVYIPRINGFWADENKIRTVFEKQGLGNVKCVEFIYKKTTSELIERRKKRDQDTLKFTRSAIVQFNEWYDTAAVHELHAAINSSHKEAHVVCDDPWYWLLLRSEQQPTDDERPSTYRRKSRKEKKNKRITSRLAVIEEAQEDIEQWKNESKKQLEEQNDAIKTLQVYCIRNGLNVPFWTAKAPPCEKDTLNEISAAETAVACAGMVLNE